ncbi:MAG: hypothetical protein ACRDJE_25630 [Dehalococcoidia bacterium]
MPASQDQTLGEWSGDLAVLACELDKRPKGAPSFSDLEAAIREVRRESGSLVVDFDPAESERVAALVDAERQCCPDIGWELQRSPALRLRISATPAQLDVFEGFLVR